MTAAGHGAAILDMPYVIAAALISMLAPATALILLESWRRYLSLALCIVPLVAIIAFPRLKEAPFIFSCTALTVVGTLLLLLHQRSRSPRQWYRYIAGVGLLMLIVSVLPALIMLVAADHNPQGEFCLEDTSAIDCALNYFKLGMIGLIYWGPLQTIMFFLLTAALLIEGLIEKRGGL
jgi:hypothetical protein